MRSGSGVSLHLELIQSDSQPEVYNYQSCGHFRFPYEKNARWKQLMEGRLISAYIVKGTDHHGGTTRQPAEVCGRENCEGTC